MLVENNGETIIDCASYIELTNLNTGFNKRLEVRAFTVLPTGKREVFFYIPEDVPKGSYSILGVLDYGSREAIEAAEIELKIE